MDSALREVRLTPSRRRRLGRLRLGVKPKRLSQKHPGVPPMTVSLRCPDCGAEMPPGARDGLCRKCLLVQGRLRGTESAEYADPLPTLPQLSENPQRYATLEYYLPLVRQQF